MTWESSKTLGGVGALLVFIAATLFFVSFFGGLILGLFGSLAIGVVGVVVLLVGLNGLANYYSDRKIFNQSLYAVIVAVVGVVIAVAVLLTVVLANISPLLSEIYPGWNGDLSNLPNVTPDPNAFTSGNFDLSVIMPFVVGFGSFWIILWVVSIVTTFLVRRSLVAISDKSTIKLFGTSGLLMLIGGFLGLIAIGYFLILAGMLLLAVAFFQLRPVEPSPVPVIAAPPQATML